MIKIPFLNMTEPETPGEDAPGESPEHRQAVIDRIMERAAGAKTEAAGANVDMEAVEMMTRIMEGKIEFADITDEMKKRLDEAYGAEDMSLIYFQKYLDEEYVCEIPAPKPQEPQQ